MTSQDDLTRSATQAATPARSTATAADQCGNCRFWLAPPVTAPEYNRGTCRENPHSLPKLAQEWCGRHKRKEAVPLEEEL